jgi:lipoprotein NlpI
MKSNAQDYANVIQARKSNTHSIKYLELAKADFEMALKIRPDMEDAQELLKKTCVDLEELYKVRDHIKEMEVLIKGDRLKIV